MTAIADNLPTGIIAFLFTDVEGSTRLVEALGEDWVGVLGRHSSILNRAIGEHQGHPIKTEGDSVFAVFSEASNAVGAAVDAQIGLAAEKWPDGHPVRVRMGIHTGEAALVGADYIGLEVHRASRISDAAHGGQIVISEPTAALAESGLPHGTRLRDLGKHRLKDLSDAEALFQVLVEGLDQEFPDLRTLDAIPNNLPGQVTSFVGRQAELAEALELLGRARLLTLTGPGGTGKTRLSLQIAAELSHRFEDGAFFVDLAPITDVSVVPAVILNAIGVSASGKEESPEERLLEQISSRSVLMVLDNFEQLLEAAPLVAGMMRASPRSRFVVTSRAPLRLSGEQEMPVPPLGLASAESIEAALEMEGVQLFVDRAMSVRPDFMLTDDNVGSVVDLVQRVDGLPLAIELVASRLRLFPVDRLADRLDARMLSAGSVDVPERQRTITNAIAWSYDLLPPTVQMLFARLSVFAGGSRFEEIEALCANWETDLDLLDGLETLVDHSLIRSETKLGMPRFRMLHVIREFARDKLDENPEDAEETRRAHLTLYADLVDEARPEMLKRDREHWLDVLEADHDNIRAALEWGTSNGETDLVMRLASGTWRFWQARGHLHEANDRLIQALDLPGGDERFRAKAVEALGGIKWWRGEMEACLALYEKALAMQRAIGDDGEIANALYNYGLTVSFYLEDYARGRGYIEEAREIYLRLDDLDGLGDTAWGMGNTYLFQKGEEENLLKWFTEAAELFRRSGNEFGFGWSAYEAGSYHAREGDREEGFRYLRDAMSLFGSHRDVSGVVLIGAELAGVALASGHPRKAYWLAGASAAWRDASGTDLGSLEFNVPEGLEPETLAALEGDDLEAFEEGRRASIEEFVAYAVEDLGDPQG